MSQDRLGLLIMAYGTPQSMDEVEAYYTHIRHGRPPSPEAVEDLKERYRAIGGLSPLNEITKRQVEGIARHVEQRLQRPVKAYMGMKHAPPFIADVVAEIVKDGIEQVVGLVLTPQYSVMSVATYHRAAREAFEKHNYQVNYMPIDYWHLNPGFITALADRVRAAYERLKSRLPAGDADKIMTVFTAHSLPERVVETGDPYAQHLKETADAVAAAVPLQHWMTAYQSEGQTGVPWLGPDICEVIPELAAAGWKGVVVCPAGFVSDHLEVLYDIDIEAQEVAEKAGIALERSASLNDDTDFMNALADVVLQRLESDGK